jgi:toxin ParE1/3/4
MKSQKAKVTYTQLAEMDLLEIWEYIAEDSTVNADRFIDYLEEKCLLLAENPRIGREYPEFSEGLFGFPVESCMIFYEILDTGIVIARVLNAKRDIPALFQ